MQVDARWTVRVVKSQSGGEKSVGRSRHGFEDHLTASRAGHFQGGSRRPDFAGGGDETDAFEQFPLILSRAPRQTRFQAVGRRKKERDPAHFKPLAGLGSQPALQGGQAGGRGGSVPGFKRNAVQDANGKQADAEKPPALIIDIGPVNPHDSGEFKGFRRVKGNDGVLERHPLLQEVGNSLSVRLRQQKADKTHQNFCSSFLQQWKSSTHKSMNAHITPELECHVKGSLGIFVRHISVFKQVEITGILRRQNEKIIEYTKTENVFNNRSGSLFL
jgi:hypothetical protein